MERIIGSQEKESEAGQQDEHWISMSDLMAGLMMVFLLISIAFMHYVQIEQDKIKEVAVTYQNSQVALYQELYREFEEDLPLWDAEIDKDSLEFRFNSPEVLFDTGQISLKPTFQEILNDFFPRYLAVIKGFQDNINEIRVEGHTSSIWNRHSTEDEAYFNNMELSQGRTRAVLNYIYFLPDVFNDKKWIKDKFSAVGFSSAHVILNEDNEEDVERSRRVSFKVMTNAETQIRKIIAN